MNASDEVIAAAISEATNAIKVVSAIRQKELRGISERQLLKSFALSWFNSHRSRLSTIGLDSRIAEIDAEYRKVLEATENRTRRDKYLAALKAIKKALVSLRSEALVAAPAARTSEAVPDFSTLAADAAMQDILAGRWAECQRCLAGRAYLAAVVMMGGLLETLFVAKANRLADKSPLFSAKSSPIDSKTKKPLDLRLWTLNNYIDVGHELRWISSSAKSVAVVLRDYRNYVHPEKERSSGVTLGRPDAELLWEVTKSLSRELLTP